MSMVNGSPNMVIHYFTRRVYGVPKMYVAEAQLAGIVSTLTGTKTLSAEHKTALESLGIEFKEVFDKSSK